MLVRYPCLREDDLCDLLKFDKKVLRAKLATLKQDREDEINFKHWKRYYKTFIIISDIIFLILNQT